MRVCLGHERSILPCLAVGTRVVLRKVANHHIGAVAKIKDCMMPCSPWMYRVARVDNGVELLVVGTEIETIKEHNV
jgi:hypothetical protein